MQQNSRRRCHHQCKEHTFQIFSSNLSKNPSLDVDVVFCPKYHRAPKQPQTTFPSFNHDNKSYTSGFILQIDKKALTTNQSQILHEYNKHVKQATQKHSKVIFPKPSKRNNICGVCKEQYSNYFKHIMNEEHKLKLITNQYSLQLLQASQKYQDLHPKSTPEYPVKIIKIDKKAGEQQSLLALTEDETKEMRQQMLNNPKGVLRKEIQAFIISSDDQKQQSPQEKCYYQGQHSSSNQQHTSSKIPKISKDDSDSVQIVSVKPSKNKQKSNKNKNSKSKNKNRKSKSKKRQNKECKQSQESSQSQQASQKKRGSVGKKGPDLMPEVRKPLFKKKQGNTTQSKPIQVLIQKSQIQNPQLDDQMQKILNNIIGGIKNSPPAQPRRKYQKGNDVSDLRSLVIGGNALSAINLSQSKSVSNYRPNENKIPNTSSNQISQDKNYQYQKNIQSLQNKKTINKSSQKNLQGEIQRPKDKHQVVQFRVAKPNPILAKLNLTNLSQTNKISLATKKTINSNMKASTSKIQKCIDLDSEQIIQMSCRQKDKKKAELQLIMRYEEKKLSNKSTINNQEGITNGIKSDENE